MGLIRLNCELFAGRSGCREPVGDSRYIRGELPAYLGWRLVRYKRKTGQTRHPRLRHPTLSTSPHYLRLAPVEANGTRLRDWNHSVAAIEDFPFPADRTNTLWHSGDQCSVNGFSFGSERPVPPIIRKARSPLFPGHRRSGCMSPRRRAPFWLVVLIHPVGHHILFCFFRRHSDEAGVLCLPIHTRKYGSHGRSIWMQPGSNRMRNP